MRILETNFAELHVSEDTIREVGEISNVVDEISNTFYSFLGDPNIREYIELYSKLTGLEGYVFLDAHGSSYEMEWVFKDGDETKKVQQWINEHDGKFLAILVGACNPGKDISAKKSLVLTPNTEYSAEKQHFGEVQVELYVPGKGYIGSYDMEAELKELRNKLRASGSGRSS